MRTKRTAGAAVIAATAMVAVACGQPDTPEARRERGLEILTRMGTTLFNAQTVSFKAIEKGERVRRSGEKRSVTLNHVVQMRRPDKLHVSVTGDYELDLNYDGKQIMLVTPRQKVYGVIPASGPLQDVVHDTVDRFDVPFPLGDLVTFEGPASLITDKTQGGWAGDETIGGQRVSKVAWQHPAVDWAVWVPTEGQPLPVRVEILYKGRRGSPSRTFEISGWELGGAISDATFVVKVPEDYEGIPVVQRASAVKAEIDKAKAAGTVEPAVPTAPAKEKP
jgi:hypothetical protein